MYVGCLEAKYCQEFLNCQDIFAICNGLNISMQGRMASLFTMADMIGGQKEQLKAWQSGVLSDCFDMFYNLASTIDSADEYLDVPSLQKIIIGYLRKLFDRFEFYFPTKENPCKGN